MAEITSCSQTLQILDRLRTLSQILACRRCDLQLDSNMSRHHPPDTSRDLHQMSQSSSTCYDQALASKGDGALNGMAVTVPILQMTSL